METVRNDTTVASNEEKTNQTLKDNDSDNPDEISMMPILAGVLIPITIFCMLSVTYSKSKAVDFGVFCCCCIYYIKMVVVIMHIKMWRTDQ